MDAFLAKLTNLSYEFFGVILPGILAAFFLALWWAALGDEAPLWSGGAVPALTLDMVQKLTRGFTSNTGLGLTIPALATSYLLGHVLMWTSRSEQASDSTIKRSGRWRVCCSLRFRIPRSSTPYDEALQPLYNRIGARFSPDGEPLKWRQFFPIAKSYLSNARSYSLVATYQIKYTLHRSITAAAAGLFWLLIIGLTFGGITFLACGVSPRWALLVILALLALIVVWGFSDSYAYHWRNFGNTIITETYSAIHVETDGTSTEKLHAQ